MKCDPKLETQVNQLKPYKMSSDLMISPLSGLNTFEK